MSVLVVASVLGCFVGGLAARFLVDLQVDDGGDWSKGSVVFVAAISEAGVFSWRRGFDSVAVKVALWF